MKEMNPEQELRKSNKWTEVAEKLTGCEIFADGEEYIYPGDEKDLQSYNDKVKGTKRELILHLPPEPWAGDILHAKVIILSLNPGYTEYMNKDLAKMFAPQYAEQIMEEKRETLNMDSKMIWKYDSTAIFASYYWRKALEPLAQEVYGDNPNDKKNIYKDVAVLQNLGYHSAEKTLSIKELPSQGLTRSIFKYLANREDTIFILMRAKNEWRKLIKDDELFKRLNKEKRLIEHNKRSQAISEKNLQGFNIIVDHLKNIRQNKINHSDYSIV